MTTEKLEKKFDAAGFARRIEDMVRFEKMDYLEAIMHFAETNGMEVEAVASLVKRSEPLRQKLEAELIGSRALGRVRAGATLDAFQET